MKAGGIFSSHTFAGKTDDFRGIIYKPTSEAAKDKTKKYSKYKHIEEEAAEVY